MTQRVNLQYSIDIEQLPTEARRLLLSAHNSLKQSVSIISAENESGNNILTVEGLKTIDEIRTAMMNADYILADIQNIIKGYLNYISSETSEETEQQEQMLNSDYFQNSELMNDLQQKLEQFQTNFENNNDTTTSPELSD